MDYLPSTKFVIMFNIIIISINPSLSIINIIINKQQQQQHRRHRRHRPSSLLSQCVNAAMRQTQEKLLRRIASTQRSGFTAATPIHSLPPNHPSLTANPSASSSSFFYSSHYHPRAHPPAHPRRHRHPAPNSAKTPRCPLLHHHHQSTPES